MRKQGAKPLHYRAPEKTRQWLFLALLFGALLAFGIYAGIYWWLHVGHVHGP
jgi:heme/copper-type cytochrome/quinol oxidase subunit 4